MPEQRLQQILAAAGFGSRRACEEIIAAGRVAVDGRVVAELGVKADPATSEICVDGQSIAAQRRRYIMLHKPAGCLSSPDPRAGYPSWLDLVKVPERLFPVGRLDHDSEGLLLLTNDGELANRLTHPRYEHPKTYLVQVERIPDARKIRRMQHGVMLDDGPTAPAEVELLRRPPFEERRSRGAEGRRSGGAEGRGSRRVEERRDRGEVVLLQDRGRPTSWLKITLREGRKHQLRRMVGLLGHPVLRVIRIGLGPLQLGDLPAGKWRDLTLEEVAALREAAERDLTLRPPFPLRGRQATLRGKGERSLPSTIAIDGPAASGKSTIGGQLAREVGYLYFDTGVMYRAVTWVALTRGIPIQDEAAVTALAEKVRLDVLSPTVPDGRDATVLADGEDITWEIRRPEVERAVSPVSAYAGVRRALTLQQRRIGQAGRVVMVGRDIGTVVLPDADLKIYLDALLAERARRRHLECRARGQELTLEQVKADLRRRDEIDSNRQHAPLTAAPDAIVVDTTELSIEEVMQRVRRLVACH